MPRPLVVVLVAGRERGSVDEYGTVMRKAVHVQNRGTGHTTMFGFRDISHDVCNVLIRVSDLSYFSAKPSRALRPGGDCLYVAVL